MNVIIALQEEMSHAQNLLRMRKTDYSMCSLHFFWVQNGGW